MSYSWLITGASSGLGACLALSALRSGHQVVATARDVAKARQSYPDVEKLGGSWLALDVTSKDTQSIVEKVVDEKNINVLVNNAGFAFRGVMEGFEDKDILAQFNTNVFGAFRVTKGAIPAFRERRNGTIVNISSTSGISGIAGYSIYAATKFAIEGASEALATELSPFGIRVLVIEPGAFRTNFEVAVVESGGGLPEAYAGTPADDVRKRLSAVNGKQPGDPNKAAEAIVEAVTKTGRGKDTQGFLRLPLGKDAIIRANAKVASFKENVDGVKHISESAVFPEF